MSSPPPAPGGIARRYGGCVVVDGELGGSCRLLFSFLVAVVFWVPVFRVERKTYLRRCRLRPDLPPPHYFAAGWWGGSLYSIEYFVVFVVLCVAYGVRVVLDECKWGKGSVA